MTRDELTELMSKCFTSAEYPVLEHEAEKFANLVAEKEREACAQMVENLVIFHPKSADKTLDQCAEAIRARGQK